MLISLKYHISREIQYTNTRVECRVPMTIVGSDNSFVIFITLAESVALAPILVV